MPRLKLTLAYVGTHYHGWQIQAWKEKEHPPTVQAFLERAVSHVAGRPTHVQGAGRTDAGVHADAQVAHCDIPEDRVKVRWQLALNTLLPKDIRVLDARIVPNTFDACSDAKRKAYTYSLWLEQLCIPPKLYPFVWACGPLDLTLFEASVPYLVGTHDFASLQNAGTPHKSTVRTLYSITCFPTRTPVSALPRQYSLIDVRFEANGFLKQMVRNLVGLMVACGKGRFSPEDIPYLLASGDRRKAPFTAPPQGLTLSKIWYEDENDAPASPLLALSEEKG